MTSALPPNLLRLFAPRPPLEYLPPVDVDPGKKLKPKFTPISDYVGIVHDQDYQPTKTAQQKRIEKWEAEKQKRLDLQESINREWDPTKYTNVTENAYNTIFVSNLSYDTTKEQLQKMMGVYGTIKEIIFVKDHQEKPKGYAFVEFESDKAFNLAVKEANGLKLNGRRLFVDVERGRTQKDWKPKKCGEGLGKKRNGVRIYKEKPEKVERRDQGDRRPSGGFRNSRPDQKSNFQGRPGDRNGGKSFGDRKPFESRPFDGNRGKPFENRSFGDRNGKPFENRSFDRKPFEDRGRPPPFESRKPFEPRSFEERRPPPFERREDRRDDRRDDRRSDYDRRDDRRRDDRVERRDDRDRYRDDKRGSRDHHERDPRDSRDRRDSSRDHRDSRDSRDHRDSRDSRDSRDGRDSKRREYSHTN